MFPFGQSNDCRVEGRTESFKGRIEYESFEGGRIVLISYFISDTYNYTEDINYCVLLLLLSSSLRYILYNKLRICGRRGHKLYFLGK